jgi:hypothetical protein
MFNEHICLKIPLASNETLTVLGIYKSPHTPEDNENELFNLLKKVSNCNLHLLITGDFNYRGINWEEWVAYENISTNEKFLECIRNCFLFQHVKNATRARGDQRPSTLDLVFTNEENMVSNLEIDSPLGSSDHACIKFEFICRRIKTYHTRKIYLYDRGNYTLLRQELQSTNWKQLFAAAISDPDAMYKIVQERLLVLQEKYVPIKIIDGERKHKPYRLSPNDIKK